MFNEKAHVDRLYSDDIIALRAIDMPPKYPLLAPVQPENPEEVWDAFCSCWLGVLGPPKSIQMDEWGRMGE